MGAARGGCALRKGRDETRVGALGRVGARSRRALAVRSRTECRHGVMQRAATVVRTGKSNQRGARFARAPASIPSPVDL
ncbi:hypothetical protein RR46_02597 [Papilio xuthus]|uniref:Uncharacterized protein n=1 Tax=Papilio xuthus TaxID=66420 RepID=A0A194Q2W9_PAPXU|nr:hypothetical protein RR46_02597 [Papilio xuthus]